jgi:DNA repair ATPase RecN
MVKVTEKLQTLHHSVQKLESVLQEVWSIIDEIEQDEEFKQLKNQAKKSQSNKQKPEKSMENLIGSLNEFQNCMEEIPEDGTAAVDFEDAIAELMDWIKVNR